MLLIKQHNKEYYVVIWSLIFSNSDSPIPETSFISSIVSNFLVLRYSMIASALDSPIPVKVKSSSLVAVLIDTSLFSSFSLISFLLVFDFVLF